MKKIFTTINLCLLLLFAMTLAGCVKRDLEVVPGYMNGTLELTASWPEGVSPNGARLLIYDQNGAYVQEHIIAGDERVFRCDLLAGAYQIIVHNTDGENIYFHNTDKHTTNTIYAYQNGIPQAGAEIVQPRNIYGIGKHDAGSALTISPRQINSYTVAPERLTREVVFYFKITGLETIKEVKGRLIGVSPGILIGSGTTLPVSCLQPYDGLPTTRMNRSSRSDIETENKVVWYETKIEFFDLMAQKKPEEQGNTQLFVAVTDGDGKTYQITVDITSTVHDVIDQNGGTLPIEIPLDVFLDINRATDNITIMVEPWDDSGTGGADPRPKTR